MKFIDARQAREVYQYHNIKRVLYRTTAAIWYNKICRDRQLTPKYISIKVNGNNKQSQKTLLNATRFRINQEIKFLYVKKQKLNEQLYKAHLQCATTWPSSWQTIQSTIDDKLQLEMRNITTTSTRSWTTYKTKTNTKNIPITKRTRTTKRNHSSTTEQST
jgi:hypothetical protein